MTFLFLVTSPWRRRKVEQKKKKNKTEVKMFNYTPLFTHLKENAVDTHTHTYGHTFEKWEHVQILKGVCVCEREKAFHCILVHL